MGAKATGMIAPNGMIHTISSISRAGGGGKNRKVLDGELMAPGHPRSSSVMELIKKIPITQSNGGLRRFRSSQKLKSYAIKKQNRRKS